MSMDIQEARAIVAAQYAATEARQSGNPDYDRLRSKAEAESASGSPSHFARNQLAFYLEVHTPMFPSNG